MSIFSEVSKKGINYIKQKYGVDVPKLEGYDSGVECLFSVYDKVCEEYNPPFVSKNINTAIRSIKESLKSGQSIISMHPEDYLLVRVGMFAKDTGLVYPVDLSQSFERVELSTLFSKESEVNVEIS